MEILMAINSLLFTFLFLNRLRLGKINKKEKKFTKTTIIGLFTFIIFSLIATILYISNSTKELKALTLFLQIIVLLSLIIWFFNDFVKKNNANAQ